MPKRANKSPKNQLKILLMVPHALDVLLSLLSVIALMAQRLWGGVVPRLVLKAFIWDETNGVTIVHKHVLSLFETISLRILFEC